MKTYSIRGNQTPASDDSIVGLTSTTSIRPAIGYIGIGSPNTPEDKSVLILVGRYTAAGTATAVTPVALDPANTMASAASAGSNHTVEPTYTAGATLLDIPMHQKATFQWYAAPGFELVCPATAANGIGIYFSTVNATVDFNAVAHYRE